jgi:hypothetical protein
LAADLGVVGDKLEQRARGLLTQARSSMRTSTAARASIDRSRAERRPATPRPAATPAPSEAPAAQHIAPIASELQQNASNHAQPR